MGLVISILKLLGGLVLLIYGMTILSDNLKKLSGGKLEKVLMNVTNNVFKGLLVGFLLTVVTHSSAATTVIVVGLVGSDILKLKNAIPIIMGANIGTTMNSQILRLAGISGDSWVSLFTPECFAPILLVVGLIIMNNAKKQKIKDIGSLFMGLGLLFTGMMLMMNVASSFSNLPILATILKKLSNPILGVLAGAIVTAIVQSSSATIGILQALSTTGKITYATTIPVILGQNIGTCVTSILASIGSNTNSKRVAAVHLYFNLIGTIIFLMAIYSYQYFVGFAFWNSTVDMGRIADFHTIFNVCSTIILLPFLNQLEKLTIITVKESKDTDDDSDAEHLIILNKLDKRFINMPSIAISNSVDVISRMLGIANKNFIRSIELIKKFNLKKLQKVESRENNIDEIEKNIARYLASLKSIALTKNDNKKVTALFSIESEFEKIGDYAYRLGKTAERINENDIKFSSSAQEEMNVMFGITEEGINTCMNLFTSLDLSLIIEIEAIREFIDCKNEEFKEIHIQRLKNGKCNVESGITFLEILNICVSILNHCFNAAIGIYNYSFEGKFATKHDYRQKMYSKSTKQIKNKINELASKYSINIEGKEE